MTPPVRPELETDPLEELRRMSQGSADPLDELMRLRSPKRDFHAEYRSGQLDRVNKRLNTNDREAAAAESPSVRSLVAGAFANAAQGIPGVEMAQAGARSLVRRQPYADALHDIRGTTEQIPKGLRVAQRIAGAIPTAAALPASGLASGAIVGGAEGLLSADPEQSIGGRAGKGALGAVLGAGAGKVAETLVTGGRIVAATPAAQRIQQMIAERASVATPLFNKALQQGQGKTGTTAVRSFLQKPDIAEIVGELKTLRKFESVADDGPEMLDAVFKVLSDRQAQIKKGLESASPTKPNVGRYRGDDVREAKDEALHAMSGGTTMPGPMPAYREAVEKYAEHSAGINALRRGADIVRTKLGPQMPTGRNLDRTTPEAFAKWAEGASQGERTAASEGLLGEIKTGFDVTKPLNSARAVRDAPSLLRAGQSPRQHIYDLLVQAGLIGGANAGR